MPQFAANLTMLFTEVPALDRPGLAMQAGFDGAEILFPYDYAAKDWEAALAGFPLALINTPPGDWVAGESGNLLIKLFSLPVCGMMIINYSPLPSVPSWQYDIK